MTNFKLVTSEQSATVEVASEVVQCTVFTFDLAKPLPQPKRGRLLSEFVKEWTKDEEKNAELKSARAWLGEKISEQSSGVTIKSLRLAKGLSQTDLANLMGTKQPHIARIEKGRDSVTLATLSKLSKFLEVDYNTLVAALERQTTTGGKKK